MALSQDELRENIQNKINNYYSAKSNITKTMNELENIKDNLSNKADFESKRISDIISEITTNIEELKIQRRKIDGVIYELENAKRIIQDNSNQAFGE